MHNLIHYLHLLVPWLRVVSSDAYGALLMSVSDFKRQTADRGRARDRNYAAELQQVQHVYAAGRCCDASTDTCCHGRVLQTCFHCFIEIILCAGNFYMIL